MRPIWTGNISFVLVNIPVRLYSATQERKFEFDLLHKQDLYPIRYARVCKVEEKEVPYEEIIKGYQYQKGRYVILTEEDFEKADVSRSKSINIVGFADLEQIDPNYYERPYYLEPEEGSEASYALLIEALKKTGKVGIAKFVLRNKEHLAVIRPEGKALILNQLRFLSELRPSEELNLPETKASEGELSIATELIKKLSKDFDPAEFADTYTNEIERIINDRVAGKVPATKGEVPVATSVPDLMAALKKSLEKS